MNKDKSSSGKHPDIIPAYASAYERHRTMKQQVRRFKSPKLSGMYTIEIPGLRITYYIKTAKRYKAKIVEMIKRYSDFEMICKVPNKNKIINLKTQL